MRPHLPSLLLLTALAASCGGEDAPTEAAPENSAYQPGRPGSELGYPETVVQPDPFGNGNGTTQRRIQQLPSDPFFQEHYYPDAAVVDVLRIFGSPTVKLVTKDSFETIDAFYAKKFTQEDGTVQGRSGNYYRMFQGGRMERVQILPADSGGHEILLQM